MKKTTIKDVAVLANVSISSVSRVINNKKNVSPDICKKVYEAIKKTNYHPNPNARHLRKGYSKSIGLILPNLIDPFFGSIANHVIHYSEKNDLSVQVYVSKSGNSYDEESVLNNVVRDSKDGVIFCSVSQVDQALINNLFPNTPLVVCSRHDLLPGRPHVYFDHIKGGYLATKHLIEMGHKKIAFLIGVYNHKSFRLNDLEKFLFNPKLAGPFSGIDKYIGSLIALKENNISQYPELLEFIDLGDPYNTGLTAMQNLISKTSKFDAVVCSNDISALGAINMLNIQNIKVPNSVSVIGYDDSIFAICSQPQLSTVVQDTNILAKKCVESICKLLNKNEVTDTKIDVRLIIRQSSCSHIDNNQM